MAKFHVNPDTGVPGVCRAKKKCRFGDDSEHYATRDEAVLAAIEKDPELKKLSEESLAGIEKLKSSYGDHYRSLKKYGADAFEDSLNEGGVIADGGFVADGIASGIGLGTLGFAATQVLAVFAPPIGIPLGLSIIGSSAAAGTAYPFVLAAKNKINEKIKKRKLVRNAAQTSKKYEELKKRMLEKGLDDTAIEKQRDVIKFYSRINENIFYSNDKEVRDEAARLNVPLLPK